MILKQQCIALRRVFKLLAIAGVSVLAGCSTSAPSELDQMAERLKQVPLRVGDWTGHVQEPNEIMTKQYRIAKLRAHVDVIFSHPRLDKMVLMTIACGRRASVSRWTPDRSYVNPVIEFAGDERERLVRLPGQEYVTMRTFALVIPTENRCHTFAWSFSHDGKWIAPTSARLRLVEHENWYKLLVSTSVPGTKPSSSDLEIVELFVSDFVPALNQALFPATEE